MRKLDKMKNSLMSYNTLMSFNEDCISSWDIAWHLNISHEFVMDSINKLMLNQSIDTRKHAKLACFYGECKGHIMYVLDRTAASMLDKHLYPTEDINSLFPVFSGCYWTLSNTKPKHIRFT